VDRSKDRAGAIVSEISPEGVLAGRVLSATLIVSAVALIGLSWDDIWRVCGAVYGGCVERSAGAVWGAGFGWLIVDTMA
jgi:hypothetical protein